MGQPAPAAPGLTPPRCLQSPCLQRGRAAMCCIPKEVKQACGPMHHSTAAAAVMGHAPPGGKHLQVPRAVQSGLSLAPLALSLSLPPKQQ